MRAIHAVSVYLCECVSKKAIGSESGLDQSVLLAVYYCRVNRRAKEAQALCLQGEPPGAAAKSVTNSHSYATRCTQNHEGNGDLKLATLG